MQGRGLVAVPPLAIERSKDEESYHESQEHETKRDREKAGAREEKGKYPAAGAHGYTALLVNTMLRKHHGMVQRGHDVSIL